MNKDVRGAPFFSQLGPRNAARTMEMFGSPDEGGPPKPSLSGNDGAFMKEVRRGFIPKEAVEGRNVPRPLRPSEGIGRSPT